MPRIIGILAPRCHPEREAGRSPVIPSEGRNLIAPTANRSYYVYILSSRTKRLYIGVTNDLERRVAEHKAGELEGFTTRYKINRLVYAEESGSITAAIEREKQLKAWRREKKVALIEADNPEWDDLADHW